MRRVPIRTMCLCAGVAAGLWFTRPEADAQPAIRPAPRIERAPAPPAGVSETQEQAMARFWANSYPSAWEGGKVR
jgi:hypothetical protein